MPILQLENPKQIVRLRELIKKGAVIVDHVTLQSAESANSAWIRNGEEEKFLQKKVVDVKFVLRNTSLINATSFISLYFLN